MTVTLKLFASLGDYLPEGARGRRTLELDLGPGSTIESVIEQFRLPRPLCHLVLVNGEFVPAEERTRRTLKDRDELAIWPPVAGG